MAFTQADYDELCRAIALGTRRVSYTDRMVEYRSLEEMIRLREMLRRELGIGAERKSVAVLVETRKS